MPETYDYRNATGKIDYCLTNDLLFHVVMNKSQLALKGLVCSLKGINPADVRSIKVLNTIDYSNCVGKEVVLDVRIELNNEEMMDIELQLYTDDDWEKRSLLYLCRTYDNLGAGENYSQLKPSTLIIITERKHMPNPGEPEFYSHYLLSNVQNHHVYSSIFGINVLYLDQAELATENDYKNDLVHWAKLFRATTWEDIKTLVNGNPVLEEVANRMYSENTIPEERTLMEAHERFLAQKRGAYNAGVKEGMKRSAEIIEEKNALIVEKDQRIAELEAKLKELTQNNS